MSAGDRRGAGDVGVKGGAGRDRDGAPDAVGRKAGPRVEDVMHDVAAALPPAGGGAGRGQPTADDGDDAGRSGARGVWITGDVLNPDRPSAAWRLTGNGDVAAEADEHATAQCFGDPFGRSIGSPGFRGRAEVEAHADRNSEQAGRFVELDLPPPRDVSNRDTERPTVCRHRGEVAVIAQRLDGAPERRVDVAVGELRP